MPSTCPECGAALDETSCQSIFDSFLALEFSDPAYGAVHMLTVACFMIQHRRYSDEGLVWIERKLRDVLVSGVPVDEIRRQAGKETGQGKRAWKVNRQPGERLLPKIHWSMTIADVASNYQDAASYSELVRRWASATLEEMRLWVSHTD
jgi:hypothetical protein